MSSGVKDCVSGITDHVSLGSVIMMTHCVSSESGMMTDRVSSGIMGRRGRG